MDVDVLIVGGGAAGLTMSMELSRLGVSHLLVERHAGTSLLPKAHIVNPRSLEIFDVLGVADAIYAAGAAVEQISRVVWRTSLTGPTALHGRKIGHVDAWGGGQDVAAREAASPLPYTNLPLIHLEPLLRDHAERLAPGMVRFAHELTGLHVEGESVSAQIVDCETGNAEEVTARYVVGADGGRTIGPMMGIAMEGEEAIADMVNTFMTADLSAWFDDDRVVIEHYMNPDGGSFGSGVLVKAGPGSWDRTSEQWVFTTALRPGDPDQFDHVAMRERMRQALGIPDLDPDIHIVSHWRMQALLADRYREGRVFLIGDAAHRHPPTGGLGLNTAVGDAHNLAWKLREVLRGTAPDALLDTYEAERRPVARRVVDHSVANFHAYSQIDAALGFGPETPGEEGWARLAELLDGGPEFDALRARVARAIDDKRLEYANLAIDLGYAYHEGAIVPEDDEEPDMPDVPGAPVARGFRSGTRPGRRMPHAWLTDGDRRCSTFGFADRGRFVLIASGEAERWQRAADEVSGSLGFEVDVVVIGPSGWHDVDGAWAAQREVEEDGAVLVRPDGHVAWRAPALPADPSEALAAAFRAVLGYRTTSG